MTSGLVETRALFRIPLAHDLAIDRQRPEAQPHRDDGERNRYDPQHRLGVVHAGSPPRWVNEEGRPSGGLPHAEVFHNLHRHASDAHVVGNADRSPPVLAGDFVAVLPDRNQVAFQPQFLGEHVNTNGVDDL